MNHHRWERPSTRLGIPKMKNPARGGVYMLVRGIPTMAWNFVRTYTKVNGFRHQCDAIEVRTSCIATRPTTRGSGLCGQCPGVWLSGRLNLPGNTTRESPPSRAGGLSHIPDRTREHHPTSVRSPRRARLHRVAAG